MRDNKPKQSREQGKSKIEKATIGWEMSAQDALRVNYLNCAMRKMGADRTAMN